MAPADLAAGQPAAELFEFLRVIAAAAGRKRLNAQQASIAIFVALESKGTTGEGAYVDARRLSAELGLSERQIWRHFSALCERGWFERTAAPRRGSPGKPGTGRRARYRLTIPAALDLGISHGLPCPPEALSDHESGDGLTDADADVSHRGAIQPAWPDTLGSYGLTLPAPWDDTPARTDGTSPPSVGTPSTSSPTHRLYASTTDSAREVGSMDVHDFEDDQTENHDCAVCTYPRRHPSHRPAA